ncbi:MAG TPA: MarR family transcriptional regulator [Jatrophihabitans sp.]|nr:MarR family transcriptional regulator [Jatrophihabitans sp.]
MSWPLAEVVTRLRRALRTGVRAEFAWERLPMAQIELMQRLAEQPGLRVKDLADRHRLATNTVSQLVQQLVVAGLVDRQPDARDRRAVVLALTADGRQLLQLWLTANQRRLQSALGELSAADRSAILTALPALNRLVERLEVAEGTGPQRHDIPDRRPNDLPDRRP